MKPIRYALVATVIGAMFTFGQAAFAQSADPSVAAALPSASPDAGATRAEVRAELVQAEAQGLLPTSNNDYPPTPEMIARNRAEYQTRHIDNRVASLSTVRIASN